MPRRYESQERHHRRMTSEAMKRVAEARKCPACLRKSAMKDLKFQHWSGAILVCGEKCRWCGHLIELLDPHK